MQRINFTTTSFFIIAAMLLTASVTAQTAAGKEKWVSLFNGKDINDWIPKINHHETGENSDERDQRMKNCVDMQDHGRL